MREKILSIALIVVISFSNSMLSMNKANAIVGVFIRNSTLKTFGQMTVHTGGAMTYTGIPLSYTIGTTTTLTQVPNTIFTIGLFGIAVLFFGLIVLDNNNVININFNPITEESYDYSHYTKSEINIYNDELEELNAIKNTIQDELEQNEIASSNQNNLWITYSVNLSPETVKIAQNKAKNFLEHFRQRGLNEK